MTLQASEGRPRPHPSKRGWQHRAPGVRAGGSIRTSALRPIALAVLFAAWALPARADNTADEADLRFRRGIEAYRARRYEDALSEFFSSNRLVRNVNVLHNIARCYEQLRRYDEAFRYYSEILSTGLVDRHALEESLARIAQRLALVEVTTTPRGADIFVERKNLGSLGASPKILALPAGETELILSLPGYREVRKTVSLVIGRTATLDVGLDFIWGHVKLAGGPSGAEVRVDTTEGAPQGVMPCVINVKPGKHVLDISSPGYLAARVPVEVQGDQEAQVSVELQPLPAPMGNLMVTANHEGALIRVDGKESDFTPAVLSLPVGNHLVEVVLAEMRPFEQAVRVEANDTVELHAELRFGGGKTTAASKTETPAEDAPASISVINGDELRAFGYQTLPEALQGVRGLFVSYDRQYQTLGVRGFAPPGDVNNRILILVDGHAMNDVVGGAGYVGRDFRVDLGDVDHIEVVRGPVSSLFGTNAFFGVINVVLRHHLGDHAAEIAGGAGSLGLVGGRGAAAWRGPSAEAMVSVSGARLKGDEYFLVPAKSGDTLVQDHDGEKAFHGTARARYRGLSLLFDVNSRSKVVPTGAYGTELGSNTHFCDQRYVLEARWDRPGKDGSSFAARLYYDATRYEGYWKYPEFDQTDSMTGDWGGIELRYRTAELLRQHLTLGVEVQEQLRLKMKVVDGKDHLSRYTVASAYFVDELRINSALLVNASVRADEYLGSFGWTLNPRVSIIARPWAGAITKLMGGTSFRAPSDYERYYDDSVIDLKTNQVKRRVAVEPNPNLSAERILTAEIEHSQEIRSDVQVSGSLYVNRISGLIVTTPMKKDNDILPTPVQYLNASDGWVRTQGAEIEVRWQPARLAMIAWTYGYQQMVITGNPGEEARLLANAPAHTFSVRSMFPIALPYLQGSAEVVYNSARRVRDGTSMTGELLLLNAGLSGALPGGKFRFFTGVRNLLDERPLLPADSSVTQMTIPAYGRTFVVQLTATY